MAAPLEISYEYCRSVARREARNFYYGFLLLPREKRLAMCALYAYMRCVDDLADTPGEMSEKRRRLAEWREQTERRLADGAGAKAGSPEEANDSGSGQLWPALLDTMTRYRIPPRYLLDVVAGAEMDLEGRTYRTFGELREYCYHVAGAVGLVTAHVFGFRDQRAPELAERMGIAFQLTNILRDLGEDYGEGRVYLPAEDFERFGCQSEDLGRKTAPEGALLEMLRFEARRAWEFYEQAWALVGLVNEDSRRALWGLARIYSGLLEEIERRGFDVFSSRARLRATEKAAIFLWAKVGPAGAYEFEQRDRSWRGLGGALLRHRAR
jgi:phytoene synthase